MCLEYGFLLSCPWRRCGPEGGRCCSEISVGPFYINTLHMPSLNRHLNVVEGFERLNDPRGYVVWGLNAPGRVSHGKQALGNGSDKERFEKLGSHPGARPGVGTRRRAPGGRVAPRGTLPGHA
ncbi:hypothetical protein CHARACLAT_033630 [Characodon lateralis]|uniref:Uncharacterized protein n=1 Tax=Characodon lateralis TaxID=208331 RepID=A0ABU7EF25_9TELE|nr:hypothetical protein [Characodon lateralis]